MEPTQRTRKFTATALLKPGDAATIASIFSTVGTRIQEAIDDTHTYAIKITTIVTVDPIQTKSKKCQPLVVFRPEQHQNDPILNKTPT